MQHFRGSMDNWDTELLDTLCRRARGDCLQQRRRRIDQRRTPRSVQQMARDAIAFIEALNLKKVDVLGFSLGGFIAQEVAHSKARPRSEAGACRNWPAGRAANGTGVHKDIADAARKPDVGAAGTPLHHVQAHPDQPGQRPRVSGPVHGTRGGPSTPQARRRRSRLNTTPSSNGEFPITASSSVLRQSSSRPSSPTATATSCCRRACHI